MEEKTLYQHLFGQPPLPPDPELQAVISEIEDLKEDKRRLYEILQAADTIRAANTLALSCHEQPKSMLP